MKNLKTACIFVVTFLAASVISDAATAAVKMSSDAGVSLYEQGLKDILDYKDTRSSFFATGFIMAQSYNLSAKDCKRGATVGDTLDKVAVYYRANSDDMSKFTNVAELNFKMVYKALECK